MPAPETILQGLTTIANEWRWLAISWHVALAVAGLSAFFGWRPSRRLVALLMALPVMSVSALAWAVRNPFTGLVCALLALTLVLLAFRLPQDRPALGSPAMVVLGTALVGFGWTYPHFLLASSWTAYLYEAPFGLVPCPTLAMVVGVSLILGSLGSRRWAAVVAAVALLYGLVGVVVLAVSIDLVLVAGAITLGGTAQFDRGRRRIMRYVRA